MMKPRMKTRPLAILALSALILSSGCLQTREAVREQEEKQVLTKTVRNLQQTNADVNSRFQDLEDDSRKMTGRMEAIEFKVNSLNQRAEKGDLGADQKIAQLNDKLVSHQQAIMKLDQQVTELTATLALIQAGKANTPSRGGGAGNGSGQADNPFVTAEQHFADKQWKEAILEYEKYRKTYPKGKSFAESTYKIGVCFQELGLGEDARAFYEEVIAKFPKSREATRADTRLKSLKKK